MAKSCGRSQRGKSERKMSRFLLLNKLFTWAANHIQGSVVVHRVADNAGAVIHRGATRPELVVLWEESVPLEELGAENDPCR